MTRTGKVLTTSFVLLAAVMAVTRIEAKRIRQALPPAVSSLETAKAVEIKDASGKAILSGSFTKSSQTNSEIELTALLASSGIDPDANGKAEIEIVKNGDVTTKQELEVMLKNLAGAASFKLFVDGKEFATFTTDKSGNADLKFSSKHP